MNQTNLEITRDDIREFFKSKTLRHEVEVRVQGLKNQMPEISTLEALEMLLDWQDHLSTEY